MKCPRTAVTGLLKIKIGKRGYPAVTLVQYSVQRTYEVHRLMALTFLGPRPSAQTEIRHLDGDPLNSRLSNLAYGTKSENARDTLRHGRNHNANKTHCPQGHPYDAANTIITSLGGRMCRTCNNTRTLARYHARRAAEKSQTFERQAHDSSR